MNFQQTDRMLIQMEGFEHICSGHPNCSLNQINSSYNDR